MTMKQVFLAHQVSHITITYHKKTVSSDLGGAMRVLMWLAHI